MKQPLFFILYDGIENSVFESQVVQPIINRIERNELSSCTFISFEKSPRPVPAQIRTHTQLDLIQLKKIPFIGLISLVYAARQLANFLSPHTQPYSLLARGPLAGLIALRTATPACTQILIQARGLAAQEYQYTHAFSVGMKKIWHGLRAWQYEQIEKKAYGTTNKACSIEAVSPALKEYLVQTFKADASQISIAQHDIPALIEKTTHNAWRASIRTALAIAPSAHVYVYNGSAKAWQCPKETIEFFAQKLHEAPDTSFLLILSHDHAAFQALCTQYAIPHKKYAIVSVAHNDVYTYLTAADYGLLFREPHIINWVSRPTKLLEYQAVGLHIIHNNTVAYAIAPDTRV